MKTPMIRTGLLVVTLLLCAEVRATFETLSNRLPPTSNVIVAVNVKRIVESPYGKQAEWGQRMNENWARQPLMIPPGATRLIMAADVKPSNFESYWEMSLIDMDNVPSLDALAKAEGGHIDRVWDKDAVCSPVNAYFVPIDAHMLASITPAERSQIARWVRLSAKGEGYVTSPYIKSILSSLSDKTDIVMAMDLEGAYGVPNIRRFLDQSEIKEVTPQNIEAVTRVLGTMNGISLKIDVDSKINGKASVLFDQDASALKDCAKPIMLSVLSYAGMRIEEVANWKFDAAGKEVTMQGELTDASLRRLLSIVQSPIPAATTVAMPAGAADAAPADPAKASQKYYKMVCAILDSIQGGKSASETATWVRSSSKRIDQLPILNVDPALVEWGGMVSARMKQAASVMGVSQTQMNARVAGVMDPEYSSYTDYRGTNTNDSANRVASENAAKQRRQAALEQKAQGQEQALRIVNEIAETRPKIRAEMVDKYKVEF